MTTSSAPPLLIIELVPVTSPSLFNPIGLATPHVTFISLIPLLLLYLPCLELAPSLISSATTEPTPLPKLVGCDELSSSSKTCGSPSSKSSHRRSVLRDLESDARSLRGLDNCAKASLRSGGMAKR
ncbi:hypothetical protein NL676_009411 [Syzygium grande]|nr:hypothetical protein NL676_009411 [Syzygium grande]